MLCIRAITGSTDESSVAYKALRASLILVGGSEAHDVPAAFLAGGLRRVGRDVVFFRRLGISNSKARQRDVGELLNTNAPLCFFQGDDGFLFGPTVEQLH